MLDPTQRFSDRVEHYVLYRPRYPTEILDPLKIDCRLTSGSIIADVGSGTGFLAEVFLSNGNRVFGIEPNPEMRQAGERLLASWPKFKSVAATAESTSLPDGSVDFVTGGQAFHWFDREACRAEFKRILRPDGWVVLVWNDRRTDSTAFLSAYEQLLVTYGTDYAQVNHKRIDAAMLCAFFHAEPAKKVFANYQRFDFASLKGRLLSSSYVPGPGRPRHVEMVDALKGVFDCHQEKGHVTLEYDAVMYYGRLG